MGIFNSLMNMLAQSSSGGSPYNSGRPVEYYYSSTDNIPEEMGAYRVISSGKVVYIGISNNLRRRIREHKSTGEKLRSGETVAIQIAKPEASYQQVAAYERVQVDKHQPERNQRSGGGRRPVYTLDVEY